MTKETLIEAIKREASDNRLSCERAMALAGEMNVSISEIGKICNELKVKIGSCQLGCF